MEAKMNNRSWWESETDKNKLNAKYDELLKKSGFKILKKIDHDFEPYGYTALWLLSESHFAVHTFPEENKTYCELSSCVDKPFELFIKATNTQKGMEVE